MIDEDEILLLRALDFAATKHQGQRRKNGDVPYINHPIGVARLLREVGGVRDGTTLAAAILHDTLEDTDATVEELERRFGPRIAGIVAEVTDDGSLPKVERKKRQVRLAGELSREGALVRLADKLHNLRDLAVTPPPRWDRLRVRGYFCWAARVIAATPPVNEPLQRALDEVFRSEITTRGEPFRALPEEEERAALLEEYYRLMEGMS